VRRELIPFVLFPFSFFLFQCVWCGYKRAAAARKSFFSRGLALERVLGEDLFARRPGIAVGRVRVPGLKACRDVLPLNFSLRILPLQGPDSLPETDHVGPHQPAPLREDTPPEEGDAIGCAVDPGLALVQQKAKLAEARFDPGAGQVAHIPAMGARAKFPAPEVVQAALQQSCSLMARSHFALAALEKPPGGRPERPLQAGGLPHFNGLCAMPT